MAVLPQVDFRIAPVDLQGAVKNFQESKAAAEAKGVAQQKAAGVLAQQGIENQLAQEKNNLEKRKVAATEEGVAIKGLAEDRNQAGADADAKVASEKRLYQDFAIVTDQLEGKTIEEQDAVMKKRIADKLAANPNADVTHSRAYMDLNIEGRTEYNKKVRAVGVSMGAIEPDVLVQKTMLMDGVPTLVSINQRTREVLVDGQAMPSASLVNIDQSGGDVYAKSMNKTFAARDDKWVNIERGPAIMNIRNYDDAIVDLNAMIKEGGFDTTRLGELLNDILPDQFLTSKLRALKQRIEQSVFSSLRATMGAAFTEKEGTRVLKASFDVGLPLEENIRKIQLLNDLAKNNLKNRDAQSAYFKKYDTIVGYEYEMSEADAILIQELGINVPGYSPEYVATPAATDAPATPAATDATATPAAPAAPAATEATGSYTKTDEDELAALYAERGAQ